ncbi:hypothetical protein ABT301_12165 [Streptomyces sp. NPDC000987]|uniref:hypothetical protein n=1 Tax=Streptomyces sp. NPDC000987 TaxID=3154374 RepID=UPI0033340DB6
MLAFFWFYVSVWSPVLLAAVVGLLGWGLFRVGRSKVSENPVKALRLMEWRILLPGSLAAAASAAIILVEFYLQAKEGWSDQDKRIVAAFSTAITTCLGALFVKGAESYDKSWIAQQIRQCFQDVFANSFPRGSEADLAVNEESDWDPADRRERVQRIAQGLEATQGPG